MKPTDRYGLLFLELITVLLLAPFFGGTPIARVAMVLAVLLVVSTSFRATGLRHHRIGFITLGITGLVMMPIALTNGRVVETVVPSVIAIGLAIGPPNIVRRIFEHGRITFQLVVAALCAYLQVGFAFAFGFAAIDTATAAPVFTQGTVGGFFDYVYFSFVTLTTVGYGDLTAQTDVLRTLSILETLLGQIFLVVLVAYLVGTLSSNPHRHTDETADTKAQPER